MTALLDDLARVTALTAPTPHPLDEIEAFLSRFVAYPSDHALVAHVLWIAHAHLIDAFESTPRLAFLSPEPGSGKSRCLEVTELLVPRPIQSVNVTPAFLFRRIGADDGRPTVLFDEIDTVFGPKAKDANEEIRALLNAGHRRASKVGRCVMVGNRVETEELSAYAAVAMAGLGDLPDTILTRSVIIRMRRRGPGETVEPFRRREHSEQAAPLHEVIERWAACVIEEITAARPAMPPDIVDRDADVWEPLLAVADAVAGDWPARARSAAVALVRQSKQSSPSLGLRLLADLRTIFGLRDFLATGTVITGLLALDEAPWGDLQRGREIDARGLSQRLKIYGIASKNGRESGGPVLKGYARADFVDSWERYLPVPPQESATSATHDAHPPTCSGVAHVAEIGEGERDVAGASPGMFPSFDTEAI